MTNMTKLKENWAAEEICNFFWKLIDKHNEDRYSTNQVRYWKNRGISKTDENVQSKE